MRTPTFLVHQNVYQELWQKQGLIQVGPQLINGPYSLQLTDPSVAGLRRALGQQGVPARGVLIQYTDAYEMRRAPLRGLREWPGPRLLACGDLHHGNDPLNTLFRYFAAEPHDAVLLTFNPMLLPQVRAQLPVPVRCLPPSFFRYPATTRAAHPRLELLHVGTLGAHHPRRRELVTALASRQAIPFRHASTNTAAEAAALYAQYALVLNVPLNNDLNHRVFEVMAAGVPQVIVGDRSLLGDNSPLAQRPDLFWAKGLEELEILVQNLFSKPEKLLQIPVEPPRYWDLNALLKQALAP